MGITNALRINEINAIKEQKEELRRAYEQLQIHAKRLEIENAQLRSGYEQKCVEAEKYRNRYEEMLGKQRADKAKLEQLVRAAKSNLRLE